MLEEKEEFHRNCVITDKYYFFWDGFCSQWYPSPFQISGIMYSSCEQWMMYNKAKFFGDYDALISIMNTNDPRKQKKIGRAVKNFDADKWNSVCREIVYKGNMAKFLSTKKFKDLLLETGERIIVEASPLDTIWGIGMDANDPGVEDPDNWKGTNWLGEEIMKVRATLQTQRY